MSLGCCVSAGRSWARQASAVVVALTLGGCHGDGASSAAREQQRVAAAVASANAAAAAAVGATGAQIIAAVQTQAGSPVAAGVADSFKGAAGGLQPQFAAAVVAAESKPANVVLPQVASGAMHVQDKASGASVDVSIPGAQAVTAQTVNGYVVYPSALGVGMAILHRALPAGSEDFVYLSSRPAKAEVDYKIALGSGVAGLRLVGGVLELLDKAGTPQLHVSPPSIVAADGTPTDGTLAVQGCAVDSDPSPPWGRAVTAPGATTCTVQVTWPDAAVTYPAILDPRWTTTGSMATARIEHTLILLSTGKALAAGGRSSTTSTTALATAELYDRTTGTWSATASMSQARRLHTATQLGTSSNQTTSGKILVAGGINGSTSSNAFELYSPSAGTWISGTMNTSRHGHTATLLADGRVLAAGGLSGSTTLTSASLYNPASGSGTWVATTGPIPPPGLKNHTATLIQTSNNQLNNRVLLVGGNDGTTTISAVYLFDPVQNAFSTLASIPSPAREQHTAMTLQNSNGKILIAGGRNTSGVLASAIVFDPSVSNGTWSSAGTMTSPRVGHTMTLLPNTIVANGQVLVAGGSSNGTNVLSSAELFSGTSTWTATPSMAGPLEGQQAVLLSGNMILATGGLSSSTTVQSAAYLYDASFGLACSSNSQCASGFCANGVCCDTACNSGTCGACNLAGHLGTCTPIPSGTVCRAPADLCDAAETCNGTSFACPADAFQPSGTTCRAAAGSCDVAETCSGTSILCPSDTKKPQGTVCRAVAGDCDKAEVCDGSSAACPSDSFLPPTTVCRAAADLCDLAETCTGQGPACPPDTLAGPTVVCRPAAAACDAPESCTGFAVACPPDLPQPDGASCDDGDACTATSTCSSAVCVSGPLDPVCAVTPRLEGVVTIGDTKYAIFSYNNRGSDTSIPRGLQNQLSVNGTTISSSTPPPAWFLAGDHPGAYTPKMDGASLSWTVGGTTVTADGSSHVFTPTTQSQGQGVLIADVFVPVVPDLTPYRAIPSEPQTAKDPETGDPFNGVINGQLTVSPSGAAIYTIPISIPPGIAGIAPALSLVYNSQGGSGLAGQSFELTGLSAITRCPRNKATDGYSSPVQELDADPGTDAVCIDGQRLFERSSGAGRQYFETAVKDFSTISYDSTTASFTVVTKAGQIRTYGSASASQVQVPGPKGTVTTMWLLDRVSDQWGNYYTVQYNKGAADFLTQGVLPSEIDYTGHSAASSTPIFHTVTFDYEPINYAHYVRLVNSTIPRSSRLKTIDTGIGRYSLTYLPDEPMMQSRLQTLKYCAPDGTTCLEPMDFNWEGGQPVNQGWVSTPAYTLPASIAATWKSSFFGHSQKGFSGTQFVDLDGDGRVDFVRMKAGQPNAAWRNTGSGWESRPDWIMQGFDTSLFNRLTDGDGKPAGGFFADFDGDGILDFISAPKPPCDCPGFEIDGYCLGTNFCPNAPPITVWLNRIRNNQGWQQAASFSETPSSWGTIDLTNIDSIQDMNGDGLADIVRQADSITLKVLINQGLGFGWAEDPGYEVTLPQSAKNYALMDLNGDGSPDLISNNGGQSSSVLYNIGSPAVPPELGSAVSNPVDALNGAYLLPESSNVLGDIDGDGKRDLLYWQIVFSRFDPSKSWNRTLQSAVWLGNGLGYSSGQADPLAAMYLTSFNNLINSETSIGNPMDPLDTLDVVDASSINTNLVDINADGLADLVFSPQVTGGVGQGYVHFNNGRGWLPKPGAADFGNSPVPSLPYPDGPATFVDLNGDGVVDVVSDSGAWLNAYIPPAILGFSNGIATATVATYETITTDEARTNGTYADAAGIDAGTRIFTPPVRVVSSLKTDDGIGGTTETKYQYTSMRASTTGHGPQGFATVKTTDPANIVTLTTFSQHYPYTGMPVSVVKGFAGADQAFDTYGLSKTETTYCDDPSGNNCTPPEGASFPPETSLFIFPKTVKDTTQLRTSFPDGNAPFGLAGHVTTTTTTQYDDVGNPIQISVDTNSSSGGEYQTVTTNTYGDPDSLERQLGKVTRTEVNTTRINPTPVPETGDGIPTRHVTEYEYSYFFNAYALAKSKVEPDSTEPGAELHTAFDYDEFGNVVTTTVCASDFANCAPGSPGPADMPNRTTRVSYDPMDFNAPSGPNLVSSLDYPKGRHPVMTTNPLGQREFIAFDPASGLVRQKTAINGVHSCMFYNALNSLYLTGERCGTGDASGTYVHRYHYDTRDIPNARIVTVTQPPTGPSWEYSDVYGRTVATRVRSFDNDHNETRTEYDHLGRVHRVSKPFFSSEGPIDFTTTSYDDLGRATTIETPLGNIDGTNASSPSPTASTTVTLTYFGTMIRTDQTALVARSREETKNVLGKVSSIKDADGNVISYLYDAEGNLTSTRDPNGNSVVIQYDGRGRKKLTRDPDLGQWTYLYDGFGDLQNENDANGTNIAMAYDGLGRMIGKTDRTGASQWVYDTAPVTGPNASAGLGKLAFMIGPTDDRMAGSCTRSDTAQNVGKRPIKSFQYNQYGELSYSFDCADGQVFQTTYEYDSSGRQFRIHYPDVSGDRLTVENHYTQNGYLQYVKDVADQGVYWQALEMNAAGQVTREQTRNGVETVVQRNPLTGWTLGSKSTAHAQDDQVIQDWLYGFDEVGNLKKRLRQDRVNARDTAETFDYDDLDRLIGSALEAGASGISETYQYDALGNFTGKAGVSYTYGTCGAGPHAPCTVGDSAPFAYDGNGNMLQGSGRTLTYSSSNKALTIASGGLNVDLIYGADGNRVVQQIGDGATAARTIYVGLTGDGASVYERTRYGTGKIEHTEFVYAGNAHGGAPFAIRTLTDDGGIIIGPDGLGEMKYYHRDHLGSVTAMSDREGHVVDSATGGRDPSVFGYDAWGAQRTPEGTALDPMSVDPPQGHRGFTGQETIGAVGLVNMNGRLYDPVVGRFLSPDTNTQFVANLQSYNRYSYVLNNPLRYTDPTGYFSLNIGWAGELIMGAVVIGACAVGNVACAVAIVTVSAINYTSAVSNGAPWDEALVQTVLTAGLDYAFSEIGGTVANALGLGGSVWGGITSGAVSSAASATFYSLANGSSLESLGENILIGAAEGAASAAYSVALRAATAPVTQAEASPATTNQSGARNVEVRAWFVSFEGYKCEQCNAPDLDIYPDGPGPLKVPLLRDPIYGPGGVMDYIDAGREPGLVPTTGPWEYASLVKGAVVLGLAGVETIAGVTARALTAADVGAAGVAFSKLEGTFFQAGATRILTVDMIEAPLGTVSAAQVRAALPNIVSAARAEGITTLQITGTFANPALERIVTTQAARMGAMRATLGGQDTFTFLLQGL